jgi:2-polyprenyl-6-methoxyphenol hydroxylase-like FAD-dependent oxidoreductase
LEAELRKTDIAVAGGGLAGSLATAMLGRAGIDTVLIDPHPVYPADFRCEKLDAVQLETLRLTGIADAVLRASTPDRQCWVACNGRHIDTLPGEHQRGIPYDTLVNTIRSEIPAGTPFIAGKVAGIDAGRDRQIVTLASGEEISARLVVLANGLNVGLLHKLGISHQIVSPAHSISIGFDIEPAGRPAFAFSALTYFTERPRDRMAYLTAFPIGAAMRVNLFGYRDLDDPWLKELREAPQDTLFALWPGLRELTGDFTVPGFIKIRPVDLYVSEGHRQDGIVLVGDAFATSCPAAGTGARKVLVDIERLCNVHIPSWLATPGMGDAKIASFYDDPVKQACDALSVRKAFELRSCSIDRGPRWAAQRSAKFAYHFAKGLMRPLDAATAGSIDDGLDEAEATTLARSTPARE